MEVQFSLCSKNAIQLKPTAGCIGKAPFMETETVWYKKSSVHGGTTCSVQVGGLRTGDDRQRFMKIDF